jgi:hypothetical protein
VNVGSKAVEVSPDPTARVGNVKVVLVGAGVRVSTSAKAGEVGEVAGLGESWVKAILAATRTRTATAVTKKSRRN